MGDLIDLSLYLPDIFLYLLAFGLSYFIYPEIIQEKLKEYTGLDGGNEKFEDSQLRMGRLIGQLERFLILTAIFSDKYLLIPMLLTAKSIVRFPTITQNVDKDFAEYYLIGTLLSFILAIITGIIIVEYLHNFSSF